MKKNKILLVCALIINIFLINANSTNKVKAVEEASFTVEFLKSKSDSNTAMKISASNESYITSGSEYIKSIKSISKAYNGKNGIKLGSSSAAGKISFNLNKNYNVTKISAKAVQYGSDSGKLKIQGTTINDVLSTTETECVLSYESVQSISDISFETTSKRAYISSFTVFYQDDSNNCSVKFDGTDLPDASVEKGSTFNKPNDPQKNGYKFGGWYTTADYIEEVVFPLTINESITIYAKWDELDLTQIKDANTIDKYYRISGEVVAQSNFQTIFVQDETGALQVYQPSQYFKGKVQVGDDVTLVGKYGLNNGNPQLTDIIDFKVNSSDNKIDTLPLINTSDIIKENANKYFKLEKLKIKSEEKNTNTFTLNDYDFVLNYSNNTFVDGYDNLIVGSYVDVEGVLVIYNETIEILVTKVVESQRFTVTFNSNGGSNVESQKVFPNEKVTKPENPTKEPDGFTTYDFDGWYTDEACSEEYNFESEVTKDIILYAKWNSKTASATKIFSSMQTKSKLSAKYTKNLEKSLKENVDHNLLINSKLGENYTLNNATISSNKFVEMKKDDSFIQYTLNNEVNGSINIDYNIVKTGTGSTTLSVSSYDIANNEIETLTALEFTGDMKADSGSITLSKNINLIKYIKFSINKAPGSNLRVNSLNIKYDEVSTTTNYTITDASIRYGVTIPSAAYDTNANYGLLVTSGTKLDALIASNESIENLYSIADVNKDNKVSKEEFISALDINLEIETTDYNSLTPVKTDANGKADENGEYYQFGINFTSALNHIDTKLCAIAYMEINGEIFITKETNYSLRTLAQKYIDEKILADNEDATSVLNAIISYKK